MTPEEKAELRRFDRRFEDITPVEVWELCWIEAELLRRFDADFIKAQAHAAATASYKKDIALPAAEKGNLEPLRRMYPDIAKFINAPKLPGKHLPQPKKLARMSPAQRQEFFKQLAKHTNRQFRLRAAYDDARRIRDLWRERDGYAGKRHGHFAVWYAARMWGLDAKKLQGWKPGGEVSGKKKPRNKTSS